MTAPMRAAVYVLAVVCLAACSNPEKERLKQTTIPTYDKQTGRLKELTYDMNKDGRIDTWAQMDGARPVLSRIDRNQDGKIDRWEYYDEEGQLLKVGFSRADNGSVDAWAFSGPDGKIVRIEVSSTANEDEIDRWEYYAAGAIVKAEEDTDRDGRPDKWETYASGAVSSASFDENRDGQPDRRLSYDQGRLVTIESEPDGRGGFQRRFTVR